MMGLCRCLATPEQAEKRTTLVHTHSPRPRALEDMSCSHALSSMASKLSLKSEGPASSKPWDDCSPAAQVDLDLMRDLESEPPH